MTNDVTVGDSIYNAAFLSLFKNCFWFFIFQNEKRNNPLRSVFPPKVYSSVSNFIIWHFCVAFWSQRIIFIYRQTFYTLQEWQEEREQFVRDFQQLVLACKLSFLTSIFWHLFLYHFYPTLNSGLQLYFYKRIDKWNGYEINEMKQFYL